MTLFWLRKHLVQMVNRFLLPFVTIVVVWRLGSQRRLVWRLEWDTLCPNCGPFPHNSHFNFFSFDSGDLIL